MGRELRRVPMDFDWPLNQPWDGFINHHYDDRTTCPYCENGYSPAAQEFRQRWYSHYESGFRPEDNGSTPVPLDHPQLVAMAKRNVVEPTQLTNHFNGGMVYHLNDEDVAALIDADRLVEFTHTWTRETGWVKKDPPYVPTALEVNEWARWSMGHDAINDGVICQHHLKKLGLSSSCEHCDGHGYTWDSKEDEDLYENWTPTDPPTGEGFQIWETVSEGSPISPVFTTTDELAEYMSHTTYGADKGTSKEQWLKFINGPGWAPSLIVQDGVVMSGVQAMTPEYEEDPNTE